MTVEAPQIPAYRTFAVRVARLQRLSPSFLRVTFTGADLDDFAPNGWDQRIKVLLPLPAAASPTARPAPTGTREWRALPDGAAEPDPDLHRPRRPAGARARSTSTSCCTARPARRRHGPSGPRCGDEVVLIGPERPLPRPDRRLRVAPAGRRLVPARRRRRDGGPGDLRDRRVAAGRARRPACCSRSRRPATSLPLAAPGRRRGHLAAPAAGDGGARAARRAADRGRRRAPRRARRRRGPRRGPRPWTTSTSTPGSCGRCRTTCARASSGAVRLAGRRGRHGEGAAPPPGAGAGRRPAVGRLHGLLARRASPATDRRRLRLTPCQRAVSHGPVTGCPRRPGDRRPQGPRHPRLLRARRDPGRPRRRSRWSATGGSAPARRPRRPGAPAMEREEIPTPPPAD